MNRGTAMQILLDHPSNTPGLGFGRYADALAAVINASSPQFAIGVFGGWGSGKTTLMGQIERRLGEDSIPIWFNAWRYEREAHLIVPLLDTIRAALVKWVKDERREDVSEELKTRALAAASTASRAARAILAGLSFKARVPGLPGSPELMIDPSKSLAEWDESREQADDPANPQSIYFASFQELQDSFKRFFDHGTRRIVLFIDDLDRCLPENALQVLESMKLFFDLEGFVFVVGLDQDVIESAVEARYAPGDRPSPISGHAYIEKLFQVPFRLPEISGSRDLYELLGAVTQGANLPSLGQLEPHLEWLVTDAGVTPREVKRFINAWVLRLEIERDLDADAALALQTLAFRPDWRAAYRAMSRKKSAFFDAVRHGGDNPREELRLLDSSLRELPDSFFDWLKSDAARPLTRLDAPALSKQVEALEATRQPPSRRSDLGEDMESVSQILRSITPVDDANEAVDKGVAARTRFVDIIERLRESTAVSAGREAHDAAQHTLDALDGLVFALRRVESLDSWDTVAEAREKAVRGMRDVVAVVRPK